MEILTPDIQNEIELANALTLQAIEETYKTTLRSNRSPVYCG